MKVGIIGAGIAGLAAAVRMACQGHEVDVFEANSYPGGKLSAFELGKYRFDAGPSLFTMPQYVDELFELAGENPRAHFDYLQLDTVCHYFWEDGTRLNAYADPSAFANETEQVLQVPKERLLAILKESERKYQLTGKTFLEKSLHKMDTWFTKEVAKAIVQIPTLDLFRSMNRANERIAQHPKLVQLFNRFATYNGSNPYKAPGLLNIIPHFEHHFGAYFPKGGMHAITDSIYELGKRKGVKFHFDAKVSQILVEKEKAVGLRVQEQHHAFDRVICNMDIFHAYRHLLPDQKSPERILKQPKSTSALIFYWGIKKSFPELGVHNIFFSENYKKEFATMEKGSVFEDPTVYINITSKEEAGDAPEGCENWFVMINVPPNQGQDWAVMIPQIKKYTLEKLSRILGIPVASLIEEESILDPILIESRTQSHQGALYGTSSNNKMAAFLRHPNFSKRIQELYFCGGSVHPGGGIPLCLLSAKIIDDLTRSSR